MAKFLCSFHAEINPENVNMQMNTATPQPRAQGVNPSQGYSRSLSLGGERWHEVTFRVQVSKAMKSPRVEPSTVGMMSCPLVRVR